jgi:hypothetical protein
MLLFCHIKTTLLWALVHLPAVIMASPIGDSVQVRETLKPSNVSRVPFFPLSFPVCSILSITNNQWQLRLLGPGPPACDPNSNTGNAAISIYTRQGLDAAKCTSLDTSTSTVQSISWKSPGITAVYSLCMWKNSDCSGGEAGLADVIKTNWQVCYPFTGWKAWSTVKQGTSCVG